MNNGTHFSNEETEEQRDDTASRFSLYPFVPGHVLGAFTPLVIMDLYNDRGKQVF